ncbi:putative nucleotidyltransferase with HDIG domain [Planomicrobium koreense]|uniref:Putative nucleotidyltransferase with HDIG domain n=1 Tax=Planococcus koreensis TaxID=112331 RepID=A0A7W8CUL3_9BACL|nr:HD domain-containing phosphohydrolase [Planococcus koreensis]MBB5181875.1 putative nucleotidyltransferase with HDIG domain [Planococcus koreensis]
MDGLNILKNGYLETVKNGSTSLSLLGRGSGIEMMKQTVLKDKLIILFPGDDPDVQEFFYILSGELEVEVDGELINLGADDFYSSKNLKEAVHFTAKTDVTFLSVSTHPIFHSLSDEISELRKIGEIVERKDRYTFKHSSRVSKFAVKTASKMDLGRDRIHNLFIASILHDIGKINIPEEVLKKPAKLTDEEFALVKKHPGDGADMLRKTAYADLADIVEQHHERINGRGYPFGLKGDEILTEAKIIGVCDTFDAMTEDRAYRKAFSAEYAMAEIRELAGVQYDPEVVEAFWQVLKEEGKIQ